MTRVASSTRGGLALLLALALAGLAAAPGPSSVVAQARRAEAGLPSAVVPAEPLPQLTTVRFASPQSISDAGVFIGRARGYYRELGIDVETVLVQSAPDTIAPMATGEIQVGGGTFSIALLNAIDRGISIRAVADKGTARAGFDFSQMPLRLNLQQSGQVRTLTDLRGRRVAVASQRSGAEAIVAQVLAQGGVGITEVDLAVLGYPEMLVAFSNNAIDAGVVIEPSLSAGITRGLITPWELGRASTAFGGAYQAGVLYFSGQFAAQTDLAQRFMIGYLRGIRDYNDAFLKNQGRADVVRILIDSTAVKDPTVYDSMQMASLDPDGQLTRQSLQIELDYFRAREYYTGPSTLDQVIDTSFAEYAAQQLGPYQ
jgi:NitT/TauT family transport system substrate-binding protein